MEKIIKSFYDYSSYYQERSYGVVHSHVLQSTVFQTHQKILIFTFIELQKNFDAKIRKTMKIKVARYARISVAQCETFLSFFQTLCCKVKLFYLRFKSCLPYFTRSPKRVFFNCPSPTLSLLLVLHRKSRSKFF